jgi:16S rRNA (cytidine1402-2'-O)-methyltransferase
VDLGAGLYVVATPLGNLGDITFRALEVLRGVSLICAEDTRRARALLTRFAIRAPLTSLFGEAERRKLRSIVARIEQGQPVALISESGTPCVSDPGAELVSECHRRHLPVWPIPGPCAAVAALSTSGLPAQGFRFLGFLPKREGEREAALRAHLGADATLILFCSAREIGALLNLALRVFGDCDSFLWREGTKLHEEGVRAPLSDLARRFAAGTRGEITLLIRVPPADGVDPARIREAAALARTAGLSARDAAALLSRILGIPRKDAYEAFLNQR